MFGQSSKVYASGKNNAPSQKVSEKEMYFMDIDESDLKNQEEAAHEDFLKREVARNVFGNGSHRGKHHKNHHGKVYRQNYAVDGDEREHTHQARKDDLSPEELEHLKKLASTYDASEDEIFSAILFLQRKFKQVVSKMRVRKLREQRKEYKMHLKSMKATLVTKSLSIARKLGHGKSCAVLWHIPLLR